MSKGGPTFIEDITEEDLEAAVPDLTDEERTQILEALDRLEEDGIMIGGDIEDDEDGLTLGDAIQYLKVIEELREKASSDPLMRGQWARMSGRYSLIGDTVPVLPAGYYDLGTEQERLYFIPIRSRADKLLRFPHAEVDTVIDEIERFWAREETFAKFGLPYKRGILMYGPPGSGKTSALQLIARDVVDRGGIVVVWDTELFLHAYRQVRLVQPETPMVVLMEDLDAILDGRKESQVLNLLDGAEQLHKVIFVATTNYPEKLGSRIINRPSRFDKRIHVGHPDKPGRLMYLESLIEGHDVEIDLQRYVKDTDGMSLAHLKELFVATVLIGTEYDDALKHLKAMHLDRASSDDDSSWDHRTKQDGIYF